jgi:hypothetical protein
LSRDKTDTELCEGLKRVIKTHISNYDRIITLRAFIMSEPKIGLIYDLIEIPKSLLEAVDAVVPSDFSQRTRMGGSRASVQYEGKRAWTLVFDGSDEKITIAKLNVYLCTFHANWFIPSLNAAPIPDPESP